MRHLILALVAAIAFGAAAADSNYAKFNRYEADNAAVKATSNDGRRVVFMGNSITDFWPNNHPAFFTENGFIGRGISGQTSYEMLSRFREDVVNLAPAAVVICCGTNDIALNLYNWYNEDRTFGNIASMADIASANGIKVILATLPPVTSFPWRHEVTDFRDKITSLNARIKSYAEEKGYGFADYYSALVADGEIMNPAYSGDGVHPNPDGYTVMEAAVLPEIIKIIE